MLARAAELSPTAQQATSTETMDSRPAWRDDRIPLLGAVPQMIPGTHPVEDEDDIVAVVDYAMSDSVRTPQELQEWLTRQQLQMMRSGMLGQDGRSPTMAERTIRSLAKYLAVRQSVLTQMGRVSQQ